MKYGLLFLTAGALMAAYAAQSGGYGWIGLWPAGGFLLVGVAYLNNSPRIYGKRPDGTLGGWSLVVLLPFLLYVWSAWHVVRWLLRENAVDRLDERIYIGRRLLASELPELFDNVVDLTCEFIEPKTIRAAKNYVSFPILDAYAPPLERLQELAARIAGFEGTTFIHCAQGHGRTGMVAAAVLMHRHPELSPSEAIARLKAVRPALSCNTGQMAALTALSTAARARVADDGKNIVAAET